MTNPKTLSGVCIDCPDMVRKLTRPQIDALVQIYKLYLEATPKRWFTVCELRKVSPQTLKALADKGFLERKTLEFNKGWIIYYQSAGKGFEIIPKERLK